MDYSNRVNSKKGSGGVADAQETNVHTRRRLKELLTTQVLDIDNDPYVFRNHLGLLECKLCLTTHVSESSYISHLGGRKHQLNLEKRRILDEKYNNRNQQRDAGLNSVSISNVPKRVWNKIGKPAFKVTKIRDTNTLKMGILINVKYPKINFNAEEPMIRFMSFYELSQKNQNVVISYVDQQKSGDEASGYQYLIISAEPYENICIALPNKEIDKPKKEGEMSDTYWWFWDKDTKEFFLQMLYKE
ncbi:pre-mRNA-splicing factor Prp11p [[Candida] anglica]|uniref:Pre-mRNA-splicing factor Prp11p n=1 Tax=[Candida] anglica TaxID=148631 RepID=A0ABP0E8Q0_9ASCO